MDNMDKKIALVTAITELSIEITNKTTIDIFVDFSSHVKSLSIKVLLKGWNQGDYTKADYNETIYLDWNNAEKELQEVIDYLGELKNGNMERY